jgi:hypothetical protein
MNTTTRIGSDAIKLERRALEAIKLHLPELPDLEKPAKLPLPHRTRLPDAPTVRFKAE